jgi:hypothetical protein
MRYEVSSQHKCAAQFEMDCPLTTVCDEILIIIL